MAKSKTPARKPAKPAPKAPPKKAPPPSLRPGHRMSERKLAGLRNKKGLVEFFLGFDLIDLIAAAGFAALDAYVRERAVPPGYRLDACVYTPVGVAGKKIQLKVSAKIEPAPEPEPEPAPALKIAEPVEFKDTSGEEAEEASRLASEHGGEVLRAQLKAEGKAVRVGVTASVATRDGKHRAAFEADTWLAQAQDSEILQLARDGYKDTTAADGVAEYMQRVDALVGDVIRAGQKPNEDAIAADDIVGFEVTIDEDKILEWVEANRPHLLPGLASIKDGAAPPEEPAATA